jgi:hypothetical protein
MRIFKRSEYQIVSSTGGLLSARRFHHIRSISSSSTATSLTATPVPSGYSTPIAGPSNYSVLPPSSPPLWSDAHGSDIEEDKTSDDDQEFPAIIPSLSGKMEACPGSLIQWQPGSVWISYPYQQHDVQTLPWEPIGFGDDNQLRLRSAKCKLTLETFKERKEQTCSQCRGIETSAAFAKFVQRAISPAKHTPWVYLSHTHVHELLVKATAETRHLKLKVGGKYLNLTFF